MYPLKKALVNKASVLASALIALLIITSCSDSGTSTGITPLSRDAAETGAINNAALKKEDNGEHSDTDPGHSHSPDQQHGEVGNVVTATTVLALAAIPASRCGNLIQEAGEQCDAGLSGSATCTANCTLKEGKGGEIVAENFCGDGTRDAGEQCDDGNSNNADSCTQYCKLAVCGDGYTQPSNAEQCDDKNKVDTDACSNKCQRQESTAAVTTTTVTAVTNTGGGTTTVLADSTGGETVTVVTGTTDEGIITVQTAATENGQDTPALVVVADTIVPQPTTPPTTRDEAVDESSSNNAEVEQNVSAVCPYPPHIANVHILWGVPDDNSFACSHGFTGPFLTWGVCRPGIEITYKCSSGYRSNDIMTNVCQANGSWSNGAPKCRWDKKAAKKAAKEEEKAAKKAAKEEEKAAKEAEKQCAKGQVWMCAGEANCFSAGGHYIEQLSICVPSGLFMMQRQGIPNRLNM